MPVFADMAHLYQLFVINECRYLIFGQASIVFCELTETRECTIANVGHLLFGIQEGVKPMFASLCQHDCAIAVLIETFFINPAAAIICFSLQYGVDGLA